MSWREKLYSSHVARTIAYYCAEIPLVNPPCSIYVEYITVMSFLSSTAIRVNNYFKDHVEVEERG